MKKLMFVVVMVMFAAAAFAGPVSANSGGAPDGHGVDGKTFGGLVSGLAQSSPGAVAEHVSGGSSSSGGGMPAAHGVDGKTFGMVVSGLAQSSPGAIAGHVSGR